MRLLRSLFEFVCPPNILQTCCFQFLEGLLLVPREIENNNYAKFGGGGGGTKLHYGKRETRKLRQREAVTPAVFLRRLSVTATNNLTLPSI